MQKTKALSWLFPECVRRVEKQSTKAGRFFVWRVGTCSGNTRGTPWDLTRLARQMSAAWPCHGWGSSTLAPSIKHSSKVFNGMQIFCNIKFTVNIGYNPKLSQDIMTHSHKKETVKKRKKDSQQVPVPRRPRGWNAWSFKVFRAAV